MYLMSVNHCHVIVVSRVMDPSKGLLYLLYVSYVCASLSYRCRIQSDDHGKEDDDEDAN